MNFSVECGLCQAAKSVLGMGCLSPLEHVRATNGTTDWCDSGTEMACSLFWTKEITSRWKTAAKFGSSWRSPIADLAVAAHNQHHDVLGAELGRVGDAAGVEQLGGQRRAVGAHLVLQGVILAVPVVAERRGWIRPSRGPGPPPT